MKTKSLIVSAGLAFAALGLALPTNVMAQKQFTLEELNFGGKNFQKMRAETRYTTWWGDQLVRMDNDRCTIVNPQTLKETTLFTLDDINAIVAKDNSDHQVRSLYSVSFPYADRSVVKIATGKETLAVDFKAKKLESTMKSIAGVQAQDYNKVSGALAYVLKRPTIRCQ